MSTSFMFKKIFSKTTTITALSFTILNISLINTSYADEVTKDTTVVESNKNNNKNIINKESDLREYLNKVQEKLESDDITEAAKMMEYLSNNTDNVGVQFLATCYAGDFYFRAGDYKNAIRMYTQVYEIADNNTNKIQALGLLSLSYFLLGDLEQSKIHYLEAKKVIQTVKDPIERDYLQQFLNEIKKTIQNYI